MNTRKNLRATLMGIGAYFLISQAHAIAITDVSIGSADPSAAVLGHLAVKKAKLNALPGLFAGDPWKLLDATNRSSRPFHDANFLLTADVRQRTGAWELSWAGADLAQDMEFLFVIKGGKHWGAYLFEAGSISSDTTSILGEYEMSWLNKRGKVAKFRRAFIYGRLKNRPENENPAAVPISGSLALVVLGLGLGRRQLKNAS